MSQNIQYPFNPSLGAESIVMQQEPRTGAIYFTTDTRKIYLDLDGERAKIPMGGNVGLFYGTMRPLVVVDGQKEFEFTMGDIVGNGSHLVPLVPNVDDLILNSDGCFYKVLEVNGEGAEAILNTEKLTIAGTGGGGGSSDGPSEDDGTLTSFSVGKFNVSDRAILRGTPCNVRFVVKSTNDVGEYVTGNVGTYELIVGNIPVATGPVKGIPSGEVTDDLSSFYAEDINTINIEPFLPLSKNIVPILKVYDSEGRQKVSRKLPAISVSSVQLTWDYDNATLNEWISGVKDTMKLQWKVTGDGIEKITYITIGNITKEIGHGTGSNFEYNLDFTEFNMMHGAHTAKMWVEVVVGGITIPTEPIYKNIIVAQDDNQTTIISVCLFTADLQQYNTIAIPIYIYNKNNISGNARVNLIENGTLKDEWSNVPNLGADPEEACWSYTPTIAGDAILLTVQSGGQEKTITVTVNSIGISIEEKAGYAFKFKANEFASNTNIQNWKINEQPGLEFSEKFDWINGGLKSETDPEHGHRQFVAVKAGSTMTIKYPMWEVNAPAAGKHFKFIFKATNCRDYDAQVLSCKTDKKIIHIDKTIEYYLLTEPVVTLTHAKTARLNNGVIELLEVTTEELNVNDEASRYKFENTYVQFEDGIYQCVFLPIDPEDASKGKYNAWYKVSVQDSFNGLLIRAQNASVRTNNETLETQFCEDTYIELEFEVVRSKDKRYIKLWIDGVPCGYTEYSSTDRFTIDDENIVIGSPDCDVYVYLAKLYESDLSIEEHMNNFYFDAPNAEEMVRRFRRNDIMSKDRPNEIDMFRLA